eukprot:TRINITY_DN8861_c0_g1_i1.p1 TRINITY_DN8861_c0_g1~~TRINITY_DN8861_c0_g1_i1.p1  ORF type:complete len:137 (-),score=29.66 TRINITY_DN8861_c0_g1_i1:156-566(-)
MGSTSPQCKKFLMLTLTAFLVSLGLAMMILSCGLSKNYYIMFSLLPLVVAPIPCSVLAGDQRNIMDSTDNSGWKALAEFLGGIMISSAFGIIGVLFHSGKIHSRSFALGISSDIILLIAGVVYSQLDNSNEGYMII